MKNELAKQEQAAPALTPMDMLQIAVDKGADIDQLTKLMDLQERWEANNAKKSFVDAMNAFKESPPELTKNKKVSFEKKDKTRTEYKHATLDQVSQVIGKALSKHGIFHRWDTDQIDGGLIRVTCVLTHKNGHSESTALQGSPDASGGKNNIQAVGSTVTYLQRYTLLAATGMAVHDQDDDGNGIIERISDEQAETLTGLAHEVEADLDKFCNFMGVSCIREITTRDFGKAMNALNKKRAAA